MKENNQTAYNSVSCVGFIMDGNRRFARSQGQGDLAGHLAGRDKFMEVIDWIVEMKIPHAVFYAFSTENWKREKEEVEHLMNIFRELLKQLKTETKKRKANLRVVGRREDLPSDIQAELVALEEEKIVGAATIWIALSYGGRAEIVEAVNKAITLGNKLDEAGFAKLLWTDGMPDPDLIIRTSGERRLSNFLPWQSVYSELFFTNTHWPAFTKAEFTSILEEYANRERRIGR